MELKALLLWFLPVCASAQVLIGEAGGIYGKPPPQGPTGPDLTTGLVAYWKLDESSGLVSADSSPAGQNTLTNWVNATIGLNFVSGGHKGNCLNILNTTDASSVNYTNGLPLYTSSTGLSICCWMKAASGTAGVLYGEGNSTNGNVFFYLQPNGAIMQTFLYNSGTVFSHNGTLTVQDGNWHHVAWTDTGTTASLYVDNVLDFTLSHGGFAGSLDRMSLGSLLTTTSWSSPWINGNIDEVRLYRIALTTNQIAAIYGL